MFTLSNADFFDIRRLNHSFASMTLFGQKTENLATSDSVQRVESATVDASFFSTLEVAATLGRVITAEDNQPGRQHVAVISHALWKSLFAERPDVLGRSISLDGSSYRIVGVMPPDFTYPSPTELPYSNGSDKTDVWMPLALTPKEAAERDNDSLNTIARLKPGVSHEAALSEMSAIMQHLDTLHSAEMRGWGAAIGAFAIPSSARFSRSCGCSLVRSPACCSSPAAIQQICCWLAQLLAAMSLAYGLRWVPGASG